MKNKNTFFGIIALAAVVIFSMTACSNSGGTGGAGIIVDDPTNSNTLSGTYRSTDGVSTLIFTGNNCTVRSLETEMIRGTYTLSGNTGIYTVTWISANVQTTLKVGDKISGTLSGNQITAGGITFIKQ